MLDPDRLLKHFKDIWLVDFEFGTGESDSDPPKPRCVVAIEYRTGRVVRKWLDGRRPSCPFPLGDDSLYVAFYLPAEASCHVSLDWPLPRAALDLYAEFRWLLNGTQHPAEQLIKERDVGRYSLLSMLYYFGLRKLAIAGAEKTSMRNLALRGGPYTGEEQRALLDYNETDVVALRSLLPETLSRVDCEPSQILLRGRYSVCAGVVQHTGVPLNGGLVDRFKANWSEIVGRLIDVRRDEFDVIKRRDVDRAKLASWIENNGLDYWPTTATGELSTSNDSLSDLAKVFPIVGQLKEFLYAVRKTKLFEDLSVGSDGVNRYLLGPFASKTSRNQPSSKRAVFGPSCWVRSMIQPRPGRAMVYADWSAQEYALAGLYSGDRQMIKDYQSGQPYLSFAKRAGIAPLDATKQSHPELRDQLKVAAGLGVLYGAGRDSIARQGNMRPAMASRLMRLHRATYPRFWEWRQAVIDHAMIHRELRTEFGWRWVVNDSDNSRSVSNFVCQGNAAEMMRIAVCLAVERGLEVHTPVHDALLVGGPADGVAELEREVTECMAEASAAVTGGIALRVGIDPPVVYPRHYSDKRGVATFESLCRLLGEIERGANHPREGNKVRTTVVSSSSDNCCLNGRTTVVHPSYS